MAKIEHSDTIPRGTNGRSRYDTLAAIHTAAVDEVHFGPSFCPWHRLYLILIETALRVPIPYWDPTIDGEMTDPTQSVVWTNKYFGNGNGLVVTGPFRNYYTPTGPLARNIGSDGLLFSKENIQQLFRYRFNRDIFEPASFGGQMSTLEGQHNMVHFWIGGHMNEFEYAAYDPVFWNYHAYVDYVWENFRRLQVRRGVNPEQDIVRSWEQDPNSFAVGLQGLRIREGYSGRIARMVTYESMPKCPECGNSSDMFCRRGVCVSTSGSYRRNRISFPRRVNHRSFGNTFRRIRGKRSVISKFNGAKDTSVELTDLAFVPVKVIRNLNQDITNYTSVNLTIGTTRVVSPECIRHPETLHNNVIYAEADGLNYKGKYKDFAYVNNSAIIYLGAQKPTNDTSEVFITAYDRCGRTCIPNCLVKDSKPPIYNTCTGAIRITSQNPVMYLSFPYEPELQHQDNTTIPPIEFHCTF
ncbi:tyrosinase-like protein 1 [Mytilus californianus]|uniref:tyrosinase-like protein 1 n=1 Tax=Mytilus californianus TaxID=6549 RepID=UPI002246BC57|nr:tyrosinase-like protein 1 [Mytilus californianus]